jgi:hypothetical protein
MRLGASGCLAWRRVKRLTLTPSVRSRALQVRRRLQGVLHWIVGAAGIASLCAGVAVLFTTDRDARSAFLLTVGLVLVLFAVFRGRIQLEGFEIFGAKAHVRDVVKRRLELADSPARGQALDPAVLRRQAVVLRRLVGLHGLYEYVRAQPPGHRRTAAFDALHKQIRDAAREAEFDPAEVIGWFHEGTDALRMIALNLMLLNSEYRGFLAVLETIDAPHSDFEQYFGLRVADSMLAELDALERSVLRDAIERALRKRRVRRDGDLALLSQLVLDRLTE